MTSTQFRLLRVIGDPPAGLQPDDVVFNAPRPLYGDDIETGLMGFSVVVAADRDGRDDTVRLNLSLDAQVIRWVTRDDAVAEARAYVTAEYGADALDGFDDASDILLDSWANRFRVGTFDVKASVKA